MLILDPIPVVIEDIDKDIEVEVPFSPKDPKLGSHQLPFTKIIYIDRPDFREEDSKGYYRLAPGKAVGLFQAPYPIKAKSFTKDDETGLVTGIVAEFDKNAKPKAYISWVPQGSIGVEARIYNSLFKSEDPKGVEGGFLNDINPNSMVTYENALIETGFEEVRRRAPWPATVEEVKESSGPESVRFQGMRVGYFVSLLKFMGRMIRWLTGA